MNGAAEDAEHRLPSPRTGSAQQHPAVRYTMADQVKKGEDFFLASVNRQHGSTNFGVYGVFDGHNGTPAAIHARDKLMDFVLEHIPTSADEETFLKLLPRALAEGFLKCHNAFAMKGISSGTTATLAVVTGWTVTVAGVGDSRCILDTVGGGVIELTIDHRFEDSPEEQRRVLKEGGVLSRLKTFEGIEVGPLRSWPGGVCVSRSIGDVDCGPLITPLPHVKQVRVPWSTGGRFIMGSDGLWDAVSSERTAKLTRGLPATTAAPACVKESIKMKGLRDDVTVLVVDLLPAHLAQADKGASPVPKGPSAAKSILSKFKSFKKKEPERDPDSDLDEKDRVPSVVNDQDSMRGGDLYERYKNSSVHGSEGNFCAMCGNQVDRMKSDISVRAGNLLCPKHRGGGAGLAVSG